MIIVLHVLAATMIVLLEQVAQSVSEIGTKPLICSLESSMSQDLAEHEANDLMTWL